MERWNSVFMALKSLLTARFIRYDNWKVESRVEEAKEREAGKLV